MATKNGPGKPPGKPAPGKDATTVASRRREYEYQHHYGLELHGRVVEPAPKPPKPGSGKSGDKR